MKNRLGKISGCVILALLAVATLAGPAPAKSLYVIPSTNTSITPIRAYRINADGTLTFQGEHSISNGDLSAPVGLAIDTATATLFVTYEGYNTLQIINALTMTSLGTVEAPGASNLAGIVMDEAKNLLYTMDRGTDQLYAYTWNRNNKTLTLAAGYPATLPARNNLTVTAYGIALDRVNNRLWVANYTNDIYYYSTSNWTHLWGTITVGTSVSGKAISIAFDSTNQILYSGNGFGGSNLLWQYTQGGVRTSVVCGTGVMGLAVDNATGMVYATTGDDTGSGGELRVYDKSLSLKQNLGVIGDSPVGIAIPTSNAVEFHGDITPVRCLLLF